MFPVGVLQPLAEQEATCTMQIAPWEPVAIFPAQGPRAITGLSSAPETKWLVAWAAPDHFLEFRLGGSRKFRGLNQRAGFFHSDGRAQPPPVLGRCERAPKGPHPQSWASTGTGCTGRVRLSPPIQGRMFQSWLPTEHVETCAGALGQLGTIRTLWHPSRPLNRPGLGCASIKPGIFAPSRVSHSNDRFG